MNINRLIRINFTYFIIADVFSFLISFFGSYYLMMDRVHWSIGALPVQEKTIFPRFGIFIISIFIYICVMVFHYKQYIERYPFWTEIFQILRAVVFVSILDIVIVSLSKWDFSRWRWFVMWSLVFVSLLTLRYCCKKILSFLGERYWPTFIVGDDLSECVELKSVLLKEENMGFSPIHIILVTPDDFKESSDDTSIHLFDFFNFPKNSQCQFIILTSSVKESCLMNKILEMNLSHVSFIPNIVGIPITGMTFIPFFNNDLFFLKIRNNLDNISYKIIKRFFDIVLSSMLIIIFSPLWITIGLFLKFSDEKIIFRHQRVGYLGKRFDCLKFQTMYPNSDSVLTDYLNDNELAKQLWQKDGKLNNDPRVTKFGKFLRKTSLDELPQLWNVLKGEMSLVGPRPITDKELHVYGTNLYHYTSVRPGMTGMWQVSGRSGLSYLERVKMDCWYVKNWTLWYDIAILFKTVKVVLSQKGAC